MHANGYSLLNSFILTYSSRNRSKRTYVFPALKGLSGKMKYYIFFGVVVIDSFYIIEDLFLDNITNNLGYNEYE